MTRSLFAVCVTLWALSPRAASAQMEDDLRPPARSFVSPENFGIEFRIGPWRPNMGDNDAFNRFFSGDDGLLLATELDVWGYRLPDIAYLGGGAQLGWADYKGKAVTEAGEATDEDTQLTLIPLGLTLVARIDALSRKLQLPFIITGKLGYQWWNWDTDTGDANTHRGWSMGLSYAVQFALDLDPLEPTAARTMDEEWGINRSFFFFELHGFNPRDKDLPVGDNSWALGLGFHF